jgi:hypothetical protein
VTWLISPPEDTGWRLDPGVLVAHLRERWPEAAISAVTAPRRRHVSHEFTVAMTSGRMDGGYFPGHSGLHLDGHLKDAVILAAWYRSLAPDDQVLWLYDEECTVHVQVRPGATAADLLAAVEAGGD